MISSNQMSSMFQNQQAGFMQQQAQSANLSAMMGMPTGQMSSGGGFSYGGLVDPYGQQSAGRLGVGATAATSSIAPMAFSGLGIAGGFGMLGKMGKALDPFSMALKAGGAGFRAGGILGAGAAGAAAFAPYMAVGAGLEHMGSSMVAGAQQDYGMQQSLMRGSNFYNPASRTGRGFAQGGRDQISDTVRGMADQDAFTDFGELNRIMSKAMRGNMFQNTTSAEEFGKKFKQLTGSLKKMAKVMNTSMEQAMEFFDASKRMGFYNKADVMMNAQNAMVMSGGGLSSRGIMQAQGQGAAMARAQGYSGAQGAVLARKSVQGVRDMYQSGLLSERDLGEMSGGLRGEQAYRSVGRQMQQASYSLARSGIGRAMYAALAETKGEGSEKRFTGKMDSKLLAQFQRGQLSTSDIRRLASQKTSGGMETKASFMNVEKDLAGSFASGAGAQGWMGVVSMVKQQRPGLGQEAVKLLMKRMTGMGRRQVEYIMKLYEKQDELNFKNANRATDLLRKRAEKADMAQNSTFGGLMRQVSHSFHQSFTAPFEKAGVRLSRSMRDFGQGMRDKILGRKDRAGLGDLGRSALLKAAMGDTDIDDQMKNALTAGGLSAAGGGQSDMTGGFLKNMLGLSAGAKAVSQLGGLEASESMQAIKGRGSVKLMSRRGTRLAGYMVGGGLAGAKDVDLDQGALMTVSRLMKESMGKNRKSDSIKDGLLSLQTKQISEVLNTYDAKSDDAFVNRANAFDQLMMRHDDKETKKAYISARATKKREVVDRMSRTTGRSKKDLMSDPALDKLAGRLTVMEREGADQFLKMPEEMANLAGAGGDFDMQRIQDRVTAGRKELASSLSNRQSAVSRIGATAGAGASFGLLAGSIFSPVGSAIGAAIGGVAGGAVGAIASLRGGGVTEEEVNQMLKDPDQTRDMQRMLTDKKYRNTLVGKGGRMGRMAERIGGMDGKQRKRISGALSLQVNKELYSQMNVAAKSMRGAGSELEGIGDKELDELREVSPDLVKGIFGSGDDKGIAGLLSGAKAQGIGSRYRDISKRRVAVAKQLAGLKGADLAKARRILGGTAEGRGLLMMKGVMGEKTGQQLEDSGIMYAKSSDKAQSMLKRMGFKLGKDDMTQVMKAISTGDRGALQETIAAKKALPRKETAVSILTTMKGGVDKMAAVSEKLLNVMLTVETKKGNLDHLSTAQQKALRYTKKEAKK